MLSASISCPNCHLTMLTSAAFSKKIKNAPKPHDGEGEYRVSCPHCRAVYRATLEMISPPVEKA